MLTRGYIFFVVSYDLFSIKLAIDKHEIIYIFLLNFDAECKKNSKKSFKNVMFLYFCQHSYSYLSGTIIRNF